MSKMDVFMSKHERRTFSLSQINNAELARTLSWRENALFEEREKNYQLVHLSTCLLTNLSTRQLVSFCLLFSKKFNIMSAHFIHQSPPCRKKSILAKVCFDAKRGWSVNTIKWIFISKNRHLHHIWGHLRQNVLQFAAKRSAICR